MKIEVKVGKNHARRYYFGGKFVAQAKLDAVVAAELRSKIVAHIEAQGIGVAQSGKFVVQIYSSADVINTRKQVIGRHSCAVTFAVDSVTAGLQLAACVLGLDEVKRRDGLCAAAIIDAETFYDPHKDNLGCGAVMVWANGAIQCRCAYGRLYDACCAEFGGTTQLAGKTIARRTTNNEEE